MVSHTWNDGSKGQQLWLLVTYFPAAGSLEGFLSGTHSWPSDLNKLLKPSSFSLDLLSQETKIREHSFLFPIFSVNVYNDGIICEHMENFWGTISLFYMRIYNLFTKTDIVKNLTDFYFLVLQICFFQYIFLRTFDYNVEYVSRSGFTKW